MRRANSRAVAERQKRRYYVAMNAIRKAVEKAGGQVPLARALGVTQGLVSQWCVGVRLVAPIHCPTIEQVTGVTCEELRPPPDIKWQRDPVTNAVTGYVVPVPAPAPNQSAAA